MKGFCPKGVLSHRGFVPEGFCPRGFCPRGFCPRGVLSYTRKWVLQVSLRIFFYGKSSHNSSKPVLIFWSSIPCVFCLYIYTLIKVVSYYDFSVLPMSVMGFQKKVWMGGGVKSIQVFLGFFLIFFNFAKPPSVALKKNHLAMLNRFKIQSRQQEYPYAMSRRRLHQA